MTEARRLLEHEDHDRKELRCRRCGYYFCERCSHDCPHCHPGSSREGELVVALQSLETVTRSYLWYPLEGEEPGYDAKDVLAYCDAARAALAQCDTCKGTRVAPVSDEDLGGKGITNSSCPDCVPQGKKA